MRKYTNLNIRNRKYPTATKAVAMKMKLKRGDTVMVVSGKDKGKKGAIVRVFPMTGKVLIDGVAIAKRHLGPKRQTGPGQIVETPRPIDASNVMLMDPKEGKPTRVGRAGGDRTAKKSGTKLA